MVFYIYKIKGVNYIGSTNNIKRRTGEHKKCCYKKNNKAYNLLIYQYIREKNKKIELEILGVYKKECNKRIKLLVEQYYINLFNSVNNGLNRYNAFTNRKKFMSEYMMKYRKKYDEKKKDKIKQQRKIKQNCPKCNCLITKQHLKRHQGRKICKKNQKLATLS